MLLLTRFSLYYSYVAVKTLFKAFPATKIESQKNMFGSSVTYTKYAMFKRSIKIPNEHLSLKKSLLHFAQFGQHGNNNLLSLLEHWEKLAKWLEQCA